MKKSNDYISWVVFSSQLSVTPPDAAPLSIIIVFNICANGLIMALLSSSAFVYAISEILRVPADLLYCLSAPD